MPQNVPEELSRTIETLYRSESGRILATLARLLGDLDVAEEAMHEAFAAALDTWPQAGVPDKPRPWLISTARFKAINGMRQSKSQCINRLKKMPEHSVNSHRRYLIKSCRKTG
jgi:RNA polymerase sigma-70 factor (ECF subfamily)